MALLDFSLTKDSFTPIRPQKIEQLFSPKLIRTPTSKYSNNLTYQVPIDIKDIDNHVEEFNFESPKTKSNHFPRCSTGIKNPYLPKTPALDDSVGSELMLTNSPIIQNEDDTIPTYKPIHQIQDTQPIRAVCFHPSGDVYVVGSNTKKIRICYYPTEENLKGFSESSSPEEPQYSFQFIQIHKSSVYCAAFNGAGNLLATGSNDQTVHVIKYDSKNHVPWDNEFKLTHHTGTVRDLIFMSGEEANGNSSLLVTAGAGENEIIITDCNVMKPIRTLKGHGSTVMSLHHWDDENMFISGSLDGTIKLWDVRGKLCCSTFGTNGRVSGSGDQQKGAPVGVARVEPTGKLLVSGHNDGRCMLYDMRGNRTIQIFQAHDGEIRTVNFSPKTYYLLTAGYDHKIKLMDLQGDLTKKLPNVEVGELKDKIVQTAWHPIDYNFVTTCADGTATLWAIPEINDEYET